MISASTSGYIFLGITLFICTFGFEGILVLLFGICFFLVGFCYHLFNQGKKSSELLKKRFDFLISDYRQRPGIALFLENREKFNDKSCYEQIHSMTGSPNLDAGLEQLLTYIMRDYVDSWYQNISDDELFRESLKRTARRSIASLCQCLKQVDWVPFLTRNVVDDFASHLRLYRMATERALKCKDSSDETIDETELLTNFFDFELEMEKTLCRDLLSTTPHYENAYLHDLVDIILYLIVPPEDFRCRPLRLLLREIVVRRILIPLLDHFSKPEEMNHLILWLLSEISPRPDDFIQCLENSKSVDELEAIFRSILEEKNLLRGKDSGGDQGDFVKQQLRSLDYVEGLIKKKMAALTDFSNGGMSESARSLNGFDDTVIQLPIHVVLTNNVAISYFMDYLQTVGGQNYIDCYLAIEGFKVSVEHQFRSLTAGESCDQDVYETIKEAANSLYHQYLSQEAITRVPLEENLIAKFISSLRNDEPSDFWFEAIQDKIVEILRTDEHFYPEFKKTDLYIKMLSELGIIENEESRSETPISDISGLSEQSANSRSDGNISPEQIKTTNVDSEEVNDGEPVLSAIVETLGIGCQSNGKQSFALYNVRVSRSVNGKKVSSWNVLRRYSDFHLLHAQIISKFSDLVKLSFPGKKTFNNLDAHFLEKRTKALNSFMECILHPLMLHSHSGLEQIVLEFLSQKEYVGGRGNIGKKVISAMFDPIRLGVKAVGSTVMAVPEQMIGGVSKIGTGINNATKSIIMPLNGSPRQPIIETDRVAAAITNIDFDSESIPLRVLVLFVDEVFGVRGRNAWFRRQMMAMIRQFLMPFGSTLNKKIVDLVHWLTSEQQVGLYITALRDSFWPNGQPAPESVPKTADACGRVRVLAKTLMLSALPDELRLILGAETTYQGINTVSNALQNKHLNRRLLYVLLERLLVVVFPNNRFEKIFARLHSKSPRSRRS